MKEVDIANAVVNDLVSGWKPPSLMPLEKTMVVNRRHLAKRPESKWRRLHLVPTRQIALGGRTGFSVVGESSSKLLLRQDATPSVLDSDLRAMDKTPVLKFSTFWQHHKHGTESFLIQVSF